MNKKHSIAYLLTLRHTLDNLMGQSIMGCRYTKALKAGIDSLATKELEVESSSYTVKVLEEDGDVYVQVYLTNGGLLETHEYLKDNIVDEGNLGKT